MYFTYRGTYRPRSLLQRASYIYLLKKYSAGMYVELSRYHLRSKRDKISKNEKCALVHFKKVFYGASFVHNCTGFGFSTEIYLK